MLFSSKHFAIKTWLRLYFTVLTMVHDTNASEIVSGINPSCSSALKSAQEFQRSVNFSETCNAETFIAKCDVNEVVVMTSAMYGRMEIGRCVEEDVGYLGCQNDALDVMDAECSGRRECHIIVTINNRNLSSERIYQGLAIKL